MALGFQRLRSGLETTLKNIEMETVVDGLLFPESPRWHDGELWFSDMYAGSVLRFAPATQVLTTVVAVPGRPSGLGWLPDGRLLVVSMAERQLLRLETNGVLVVHADLGQFVTGDANDMVVDALGHAYVGNFGRGYAEGTEVEAANLVLVCPDGSARVVAGDLLFPNGSVISADGRHLIVAEGFRRALTEFTIEVDGNLVGRREFADLSGDIPDGIALDEEHGVWVAMPLRQEFVRVGRGGEVTDRIPVAPRGAFACALGGHARRTLFMCTALGGPEEIRNRTSKGAILALQVPIPGAGLP